MLALGLVAGALAAGPSVAAASTPLSPPIEDADEQSSEPAISAEGRYVAFRSEASNLVADDTNGTADVFVADRVSGETERVSISSSSAEANAESSQPAISADGRYVAFRSAASNLVFGDSNAAADVFVRDRLTGETTRVSVSSSGGQANGQSSAPSISADGSFVAFASEASDVVSGDGNGLADVFVRDRLTGQTTRVSVSSSGGQANGQSSEPAISADGRYVGFGSEALGPRLRRPQRVDGRRLLAQPDQRGDRARLAPRLGRGA